MPYTLTLYDGITTLVTVPDKTILGPLEVNAPSNCSLNLVGRGAIGYGVATANNFIALLQNFAYPTPPPSPMVGQIWYNYNPTGNSTLELYTMQENSSGSWSQIVTTNSPLTLINHDITVEDSAGDSVTLGCNGTITLMRTDDHPWIKMEGANGVNAIALGVGTDINGNPDLTVTSNVGTGAIWHSINLNPFNVSSNNVLTGYDTFTNTTTFSEVLVKSGGTATDIVGGSIDIKNYTGLGQSPSVTLWSPQAVSSPNKASITFTDPNLLINFTAGSTVNSLILNTSSATPVNTANTSTVYHTGNLAPIVQIAANQTITGNLNLTGTLAVSGSGSFGVPGGTSTLTLNGLPVLTSANGSFSNYMPLSGGTFTGPIVGTTGTFAGLTVDGSPVLTIAGGTVTGALTIDGALSGAGGNFTSLSVNGVPVLTSVTTAYIPITGGTATGTVSAPAFVAPQMFIQNTGDSDLWFQNLAGTAYKAVISASETGGLNNLYFYNYMGNPSAPSAMTLGPTGLFTVSGGINSGAINASGAIASYGGNVTAYSGKLRATIGATAATSGSGAADPNAAVLQGDITNILASVPSTANGYGALYTYTTVTFLWQDNGTWPNRSAPYAASAITAFSFGGVTVAGSAIFNYNVQSGNYAPDGGGGSWMFMGGTAVGDQVDPYSNPTGYFWCSALFQRVA